MYMKAYHPCLHYDLIMSTHFFCKLEYTNCSTGSCCKFNVYIYTMYTHKAATVWQHRYPLLTSVATSMREDCRKVQAWWGAAAQEKISIKYTYSIVQLQSTEMWTISYECPIYVSYASDYQWERWDYLIHTHTPSMRLSIALLMTSLPSIHSTSSAPLTTASMITSRGVRGEDRLNNFWALESGIMCESESNEKSSMYTCTTSKKL